MKLSTEQSPLDITRVYQYLENLTDLHSSKKTKNDAEAGVKELLKKSPDKKTIQSLMQTLHSKDKNQSEEIKKFHIFLDSLTELLKDENINNKGLYNKTIDLLNKVDPEQLPSSIKAKALKTILLARENLTLSLEQASEVDEKWQLNYFLGTFAESLVDHAAITSELILELGQEMLLTKNFNSEELQAQTCIQGQFRVTSNILTAWLQKNTSEDFDNSFCKELIKEQKQFAKISANFYYLSAALLLHGVTERFKDKMPAETKIQSLVFISKMLNNDLSSSFSQKILNTPELRNPLHASIEQALHESKDPFSQANLILGKLFLEQAPYEVDLKTLELLPKDLSSTYLQSLSLLLCPEANLNNQQSILAQLKNNPRLKSNAHQKICEELEKATDPIIKMNLLLGKVLLELKAPLRGEISEELASEENYQKYVQLKKQLQGINTGATNLLDHLINLSIAHNKTKTPMKYFPL